MTLYVLGALGSFYGPYRYYTLGDQIGYWTTIGSWTALVAACWLLSVSRTRSY